MKNIKDQSNIVDGLLSKLEESEHSASFRQKLASSLTEHKGFETAYRSDINLKQKNTSVGKE